MPQLISVKAPYLTGIGSHSLFASNIQTLEMPVLKSIGQFGLAGPQPAPDAGLLPDVRRHAGIAGRGNASELDTECGHHGGWIDHG